MKALNRAIDRFCFRHPNFGVKNLMLFVIIGNAIIYIASMMDSSGLLIYYLALDPAGIIKGEVWRLFTFVLIPEGSSLISMALFMYFYYFIGRTLESAWGKGKFLIYYLCGVIITIIVSFILFFTGHRVLIAGASFLNLSMFFAYATLFPDNRVLLFFFIPLKVKWLAIADAVFFIIEMVANGFPGLFVPVAAIVNYFLFCGEYLFAYIGARPKRVRPNVIDFEKARQEHQQRQPEHNSSSYVRRCAVCGKLAEEHPELDFRYCSRCAGYHCFCEEHINTHIHFTE